VIKPSPHLVWKPKTEEAKRAFYSLSKRLSRYADIPFELYDQGMDWSKPVRIYDVTLDFAVELRPYRGEMEVVE
jgi:hypothetical protein